VPSLALTTRGGGDIALDPSRTHRPEALFSLFLIDVELLEPSRDHAQGSRVYVRFRHGDEAIAWRMLRAARQFFLGQFNV
jgi:putative peptide zinc metalloprotease protein